MSNGTKILIAVVVTALLTLSLTKECSTKYELVGTTADTTKTTTTKITTSVSSFSVEQVGKIKRRLIDSLSAVFKKKIMAEKEQEHEQEFDRDVEIDKESNFRKRVRMQLEENRKIFDKNMRDNSSYREFVYTSEIDTNFVAKDSTGRVTDSTHVESTFMSPIPLATNSIHFLSMTQKSFNKKTETTTTITNTKIVEKSKSFFDRFKIRPNISAGYGITSRMLDVYAGVGITFEF